LASDPSSVYQYRAGVSREKYGNRAKKRLDKL